MRDSFKKIRREISILRRLEAKHHSIHVLDPLERYTQILSFSSFGSEIDTSQINKILAKKKHLFLPKIFGNQLRVFQIEYPEKQLRRHRLGFLEPIPQKCIEISPSSLEAILVPALAFDQKHHRLGYGMGFYDRFLKSLPHISTFGLGFREQFFFNLPTEQTDIPLQKVCLF